MHHQKEGERTDMALKSCLKYIKDCLVNIKDIIEKFGNIVKPVFKLEGYKIAVIAICVYILIIIGFVYYLPPLSNIKTYFLLSDQKFTFSWGSIIIILIISSFYILTFLSLYWYFTPKKNGIVAEGNSNKEPALGNTKATDTEEELLPPEPEKLKLYIVLPSSSEGSTKGDTILQAAGFLAAKEQFSTLLDIKFLNHKNNSTRAQYLLENDIVEETKEGPICAIFTMSKVSRDVSKMAYRLMEKDKSIKERLSIIFTVSSDPMTPSDRINYFQHFITGVSEADEIIKHCITVKEENRLKKPTVYLLGMNSPYSSETIKYLKNKFPIGFVCEKGIINDKEEIPTKFIEIIKERPNINTFCIVIAYDMYLLKGLKFLSEIGYEGHVITTATLSVGDWQEYLTKDDKFCRNYLNLKYVNINDFGGDSKEGYDEFKGSLEKWTFEKVINETDIYPEGPAQAKVNFGKLGQEIYKTILPNYISAFCYDSVRLFSLFTKSEKKSLKQIYDEEYEDVIGKSSPFADNIDITNDGRVKVDLNVKNFSFKDINKDVLIVVNMQIDFFHRNEFKIPDIESLLPSLTDTIEKASKLGMMIIFKQDWHPENHYSFIENGGQWKTHCVENTDGAKFHSKLPLLPNTLIVRAGYDRNRTGYSPYESRKMDVFIDRCKGRIFVTGVALEYGIKETCLASINKGKEVVAIKPLIRPMTKHEESINEKWALLEKKKVKILDEIPDFSTQPAVQN